MRTSQLSLLASGRPPRRSRLDRSARTALATAAIGALVFTGLGPSAAATPPSAATSATTAAREPGPNPATPGNFTGYGFDQCLTPTQAAMDTWLNSSPYLAVGIYISGDSRACRSQPHLTPAWVRTQLAKGWKLLPITLGPQASCQPRFPRYADDFKISPAPGTGGNYSAAREMGRNSAAQTVADARALGIVPGSTLWYDIEGFDATNRDCRESALSFLSAYTWKLHQLNYVSGVYSSVGSGIDALDDARVSRPNAFVLPDRIWLARWDGVANTSTSYIRSDGWRPGGRVKQYRGGHDETWGGVRINVDNNMLDLGHGSVAAPEEHCGGTTISFPSYPPLRAPEGTTTPSPARVKALQCLLQEKGLYAGPINGRYNRALTASVDRWHVAQGFGATGRWGGRDWISLLSAGVKPVLKYGSSGPYVRRVQRALNAADLGSSVKITGVFSPATDRLLRTYQRKVGLPVSGVVNGGTWAKLKVGER